MSSICLYSPYMPKHRGGGELYLLQVAAALQKKHTVYIAISEAWFDEKKQELEEAGFDSHNPSDSIEYYQSYFDIDLSGISIVLTPLGSQKPWWKKWLWTRQWDVLYYLTDGSTFVSMAHTSIMHVQVPLKINKGGVWERIKLSTWNVVNTNSQFTKQNIEKDWPIHVDFVHSPYVELPAEIAESQTDRREKVIVHIGRFFRQLHSKRQDAIIETFSRLIKDYPHELKGWKLVLIGSIEDESYVKGLHTQAKNLPIEFHHSASREETLSWLQKASIYWHATGYGVNQEKYPEKVEHFGISTIEAMTAGCVPIVINAGGQPEILGNSLSECLWSTQAEWIEKTLSYITDDTKRANMAHKARKRAAEFSKARFSKILMLMIHQ